MTRYDELPVSEALKKAVAEMGFSELTEIQRLAIPEMLAGKEVTAKAPTGTGKTCAFGVPIVERVNPEEKFVQALVLCPTRELCTQIASELSRLAKYREGVAVTAVYGGEGMDRQIRQLKAFPQIVVATPGRLIDHMRRRNVAIDRIRMVVLDEADEMLDMGFFKDVQWILDRVPREKQMSMFSATISRAVMDISWLYQLNPVELTVEAKEENRPKITQYCILAPVRDRADIIAKLIKREGYERVMVFCNTKYGASATGNLLEQRGLPAQCIHGDMEQKARNKVMGAFKNGEFGVLVATDVAARGIDVEGVDAVFNYEIPGDNEYYIHRIGRTGRAQHEGISYVFYTDEERTRLKTILRYSGNSYTALAPDEQGELILSEL